MVAQIHFLAIKSQIRFEPSGAGIDPSANCATTTALYYIFWLFKILQGRTYGTQLRKNPQTNNLQILPSALKVLQKSNSCFRLFVNLVPV